MRPLLPALVLVWLVAACAPVPIVAPTPTPISLKPPNLLTPRPNLPPPATATPSVSQPATALPTEAPALVPTRTPTPALSGTPVKASEPLQGLLLDDELASPIIGESFTYRVYLPPDYFASTQRHYPVLYLLHGTGGNRTEWTDSFLPEQI